MEISGGRNVSGQNVRERIARGEISRRQNNDRPGRSTEDETPGSKHKDPNLGCPTSGKDASQGRILASVIQGGPRLKKGHPK